MTKQQGEHTVTDRPEELLLWLDLETTGLDPELDEIIEVGAILTAADLYEIARWRDLVTPTPRAFIRMMRDDTVRAMHEASGLLDDLAEESGWLPPSSAEKSVVHWLDYHAADYDAVRIVLAGSNVDGFDRRFLTRHMPTLAARLHYRGLDMGTLRDASRMWGDGSLTMTPETPHRALDDARAALNLARKVKVMLGPSVLEVPAGDMPESWADQIGKLTPVVAGAGIDAEPTRVDRAEPTYIYRDGRSVNQWSAMLARTVETSDETGDHVEVRDVVRPVKWEHALSVTQGQFMSSIKSELVYRIVRGGAP